MTATRRLVRRVPIARLARRRPVARDATTEPDPGPPPEAVFDRATGPYCRRSTLAMPGACEPDEDA